MQSPSVGVVLSDTTHGHFGRGKHRRAALGRMNYAISDMTHGKFGNHEHRSHANAKLAEVTHGIIGDHIHRDRMYSFFTSVDTPAARADFVGRARRNQLQLDLEAACKQAQSEEHRRDMITTVLRNMHGFLKVCTYIKAHPRDPCHTLLAALTMHFAGRCGNAKNRTATIEQLLADVPTVKGRMKTSTVIERIISASWIEDTPRNPTAEDGTPIKQHASVFVVSLAKRIEDLAIAAGEEFKTNGGLLTIGEVESCVAMHFARWMVPFDTATLFPALLPCADPPVESISLLRDGMLVNVKAAGKTILTLIRSKEWQEHRTRWATREMDTAQKNEEALNSVKRMAARSKKSPRHPGPESLAHALSLSGSFSGEFHDDDAVCSCDSANCCVM